MRKATRPKIIINRVFVEKRSALEAFGSLIVKDLNKCSIRTFEKLEQPHYNRSRNNRNEVKQHDTNT